MLHRIACLLVKELIQLRRDKKLFAILLVAPLVQLLVLGFAASTDIREIALAVRDHDHSWHSREYIRALSASDYFRVVMLTGPDAEDARMLVSGAAGLVLVIPPDFGKRLAEHNPATVQVLADGADSNFAVQGLNYIASATRGFSAGLVRLAPAGAVAEPAPRRPNVTAESRAWFNPDLRSTLYMVPGVMAVLLMVTTMILTSMALVKEREEGTMEQISVTPLRPSELVAGKLLPFVVVGYIEMGLAIPLIMLVFGVPLRGSLLLLLGLSGLFLMTTLGLGLFISTLVHTQQQAMLVAAFFVMMPFILLSGFIFPVENMPKPVAAIAQFIPVKYYLTVVRGLFLKGVGWADLWPNALVLFLWGAGILTLAIKKFHKTLD